MNISRAWRGLNSFVQLAMAIRASGMPAPTSLAQRLDNIPLDGLGLEQPVTIHWNDSQIPFIEAATDHDCARALGVVHAHLRLSQMEIMRHIAYGRMAELVGPAGTDLDHALRAFDFTRCVPAIMASLGSDTRQWIENFAAGINHVALNAKHLPPDFPWLGLRRETWTAEDIITVGRLSGADVHWMIWLKLLRFRKAENWPTLWDKLLNQGLGGVQNFAMGDSGPQAALGTILAAARSGSNSFAAASAKTARGAIIANDPHLPITMPNLWLLAGYKCPSYHVIGLMLPALPFIALGRNPHIAWGGTNLHAASTDLVDLTDEPEDSFTSKTISIAVRGGPTEQRHLRESRFGPVISDVKLIATGDRFAMRWIGHRPSDEVGAMLGMNRATNWEEFRNAADGFALPGQNFTYADSQGDVGKLIAAHLPRRRAKPQHTLLTSTADQSAWEQIASTKDMPQVYQPAEGFIASANDEPPDCGFPLGFFYSSNDRIQRIKGVMGSAAPVSFKTLADLQGDVSLKSALTFRDLLVARLKNTPVLPRYHHTLALLRDWDGSYAADSAGALVFETMQLELLHVFHPAAERVAFTSVWHTRELMESTFRAAPLDIAAHAALRALRRADRETNKYKTWGAVHRIRLRHPLAVLPLIGKRLQFAEWGVGGNEDTVMKTGVPATYGVHGASYGSMARHISDLSDEDENYFTLLGGQDGWIGSDTAMDQTGKWQDGTYLKFPFRLETIRQEFAHKTILGTG